MIAQWENDCLSLSVHFVAWVQFSVVVEYFEGLSLADQHVVPCTHKYKGKKRQWFKGGVVPPWKKKTPSTS